MNKSLIFIFFLITGASCSEPENHYDISRIYQALAEQKHFYYNVEYSINKPGEESSSSSIYGSVALNRSADSGISSAYFGLDDKHLPNYLQAIYLNSEWIYELSSSTFEVNGADLITDSLHSPILINPELLFKIEADSVNITQKEISEKLIKWSFDLKQKAAQLVLIWDDELQKITTLEYKYDVNSEKTYSRKWSFDYLSQTDFDKNAQEYKRQNQLTKQAFL